MKGKRSLYEIYWEILTYCRNPRTFTSIIHRCSLNSDIGQMYLEFLLSRGFLKRYEEEGGKFYRTTEDAEVFLSSFREMYIELYKRGPEFKL